MKKLIRSLFVSLIILTFGNIKPGGVPGSPPGMLHKSDYEQHIKAFIIKHAAINQHDLLQLENIVLKSYLNQFAIRQKNYNKACSIFLTYQVSPFFRGYKKLILELIANDTFRDNMKIEFKCHKICLDLMRKLKKGSPNINRSASL